MITVQCWTGAETKALRQAMRLSIRAFAAYLGIDARTVNKWEARHTTITLRPHTQELLDTALQQAPEEVQTRFTQTVRSTQQEQHENAAQRAALFESGQDDSPNGDGGVEVVTHVAPPKTSAAHPGSLVIWEACDPPSIAAIRAMSGSFQLADRKLGGGLLYDSVMRYIRSEIAPSLLDPPRDCSSDDLFSAAASLTEIAGWMAHDGGNDDRSRVHFNQAYHLAVAAENPVLCANVCASLSHLAIQHGQAEDAARISSAGLSQVSQCEGTEQLVGRLHAMGARAAAIQGRERDCRRALEAAYDSLNYYDGSSPVGWIARFDEASLASESALCFYVLDALREAENEARKVIELRRIGDRVRSRTFGQLTLANVLLKAGAIEEAATVGSEICAAAHSLNSARVRSALASLGQSLYIARAVPEVVIFLDRLTELTEAPVVSRDQQRWPL